MTRLVLTLFCFLSLALAASVGVAAQTGAGPSPAYDYCVFLAETGDDGMLGGECSEPGGCDDGGECKQQLLGSFDEDGYTLLFWCRCTTGGGLGSCNGVLIARFDSASGTYTFSADCTTDECPDYETDGDICMDATSFPGSYPVCMCYH